MNTLTATGYGPLVALVVALLKKAPWLGAAVRRNPKVVAFVVSALGVGSMAGLSGGAVDWLALGQEVVAAFAGSVATHEVVLGPVADALMPPPPAVSKP